MDYTYNSIIKPADLITYLKIGDQDIDLVEALCDRSSQIMETLCNRKFMDCDSTGMNEITEIKSGRDDKYIFLDYYPVASVTDIREDADRVFGTETIVDATTYTIHTEAGLIESDIYFAEGNRNIQIKYKGGYTQSTVPKDLVQVCVEIAALLYKGKDQVGLSSKSFSDGSAAFFVEKLSTWGKATIDYYRRPVRGF
jgi:hypothetical protein